jgi:hypothetical protein
LIINSNLKVLLSVVGMAALVSTPMLAKQRAHDAQPAPAQASTSTTAVSPEGQVIGADPDPAIRFEIQRDWPSANN